MCFPALVLYEVRYFYKNIHTLFLMLVIAEPTGVTVT